MPTYNRADMLTVTIPMILEQSFTDFELIIHNDGSTDNTETIISEFSDSRIIYCSHESKGMPFPLNNILNKAKGEYIIILHDHDIFDKNLIKKSVEALDKNLNTGFVLQGSAWINEDGVSNYHEHLQDLPFYNNGLETGIKTLTQDKNFSSIFHACCMVRNSAYESVGKYYDDKFGFYSDVDLWLRLLYHYDFIYLKEVLFTFRTRESEGHIMSNNEFKILAWLYNINKKHAHTYFEGKESKKSRILEKIEIKNKQLMLMNTLKFAAIRNYEMFDIGLKKLQKSNHYLSFLQSLLVSFLSNNKILQRVFADILSLMNRLRKVGHAN